LKSDLKADIKQLDSAAKTYHDSDANYAYLSSLPPGSPPDVEKFESAYIRAYTNQYFIPTMSRFDGFKASGRLNNIEDEELLNDILELYQNKLPQIRYSEHGWATGQERLITYLDQTIDDGDDLARRYSLIVSPKGKRILKQAVTYPQLYARYGNFTELAQKIVKKIEAAYPDPVTS
jgi:hypothetical protein